MNYRISTNAGLFILIYFLSATVFSAELEPYHNEDGYSFSLSDLKGKTHALPDYKGRVLLVNFWASWCPPCIYEMPELTRLKKQFASQPFEVLALNVGEKKYRVRKFIKLINFGLPVLLDTSKDTFNNWDIRTLPTSFLVDAEGNIRYRVRGNPGWDDKSTIAIIEQLISEHTTKKRIL